MLAPAWVNDDIRDMAGDYRLALEAEISQPRHWQSMVPPSDASLNGFRRRIRSTSVSEITRKDCRDFIDHLLKPRAPATASNRYRLSRPSVRGSSRSKGSSASLWTAWLRRPWPNALSR